MEKMFKEVLADPATGKKLDFGQTMGRPAREMGALDTAMAVLKSLGGPEKKPFEKHDLIGELVKTGKFTQDEAEKMFQRLFKEGIVYEMRPGFFKTVGG
jgi:hypothetical protein